MTCFLLLCQSLVSSSLTIPSSNLRGAKAFSTSQRHGGLSHYLSVASQQNVPGSIQSETIQGVMVSSQSPKTCRLSLTVIDVTSVTNGCYECSLK